MRGRRRLGGRLGSRHPTSGPSCRRRFLRREHAESLRYLDDGHGDARGGGRRRIQSCSSSNSPSSCYRGRLRPHLLTPVDVPPPAAGSVCRPRLGKRTEHVLAAEDALSLPRNARQRRHRGQGRHPPTA
ncbi:hypothetical protein VPH35_118567 [Triticum aestivum]